MDNESPNGAVVESLIGALGRSERRIVELERLAGLQQKALVLLGRGVQSHQLFIEGTIGALDELLGRTPDETRRAELRKAVAEIDELRKLFGSERKTE